MEITIRHYERQDAARCCEIINDCVRNMDGLNEAARALIRAKNVPDLLHAELGAAYSVVAQTPQALLGVGCLVGDEIKRVYVDPLAHGSGVGTALMDALEAEAGRRGIDTLRVEASPTAQSFYARRGYITHETVVYERVAARFETIRMVKHCPP